MLVAIVNSFLSSNYGHELLFVIMKTLFGPCNESIGKRKFYVVIAVFFSPFVSSTCAHDVLERFLCSFCLFFQSSESSGLSS